jgi:uncharacterized protein (TIGR03067 family)
MRLAPPAAAFALAAALVGFAQLHGQPTADKAKKADADLAALQGEWVVTKIDAPPGLPKVAPADLEKLSARVSGSVLTLVFGEDGMRSSVAHFLVGLDGAASPKQVTITMSDWKGRPLGAKAYATAKADPTKFRDFAPEVFAGIYKLDGDKLVVAATPRAEGARPTTFSPAAAKGGKDAGAAVLYLARKK